MDAIAQMNQLHTCCVAWDNGQAAGLLTEWDVVALLTKKQADLAQLTVADAMSAAIMSLRQSKLIDLPSTLALLQNYGIRHLAIVDESEAFVGLVTQQSLTRLMLAQSPAGPELAIDSAQDESHYRSMYNQAMVGFANVNSDGHFVDINPCFCEMLGYSREELRQQTVLEITHPDDRVRFSPDMQRLFSNNIPYFVQEKRYRRKDGSHLWARTCVSLVRDEAGSPVHTLALIQDISDRKRAEIAFQNLLEGTAATTGKDFFPALVRHIAIALNVSHVLVSELRHERLHSLAYWSDGELRPSFSFAIAGSPCEKVCNNGMLYLDHCVQTEFPNSFNLIQMGVQSYLGIALKNSRGEALGNLCIFDKFPFHDAQQAEQVLRAFAARAGAELERQRANLSLKLLNQELEAKVNARTAVIQERENFLQTVLDTFPISVFWKDRESVYLGCNRIFLQDAGLFSENEVIGKTDYEMPWGETKAEIYRRDDQQVIQSNAAKLGIIEHRKKADGTTVWIEANKLPLHSLTGEVLGVLGTYQDISDRQRAEESLRRSNEELRRATQLKDEFLANMSHELRTPLNVILGMTEGLKDTVYGALNQRQMEALQLIDSSGAHLLELITNILDIAKIESGQMQLNRAPVIIESLCQASIMTIQPHADKKKIRLASNIPAVLPCCLMDGRHIRQALTHLLKNAVKFTPAGGQVTLEVHRSMETGEAETLQISVIDTGIGIAAKEDTDKLFQPFSQIESSPNRKYSGTGLGLALAKGIVELHGGQIRFSSEVGIGSCFTLELPYLPASTATTESP